MKYTTVYEIYFIEERRDAEMELAIITARQVIELFILIAAGVLLKKIGMISKDTKRFLSDLLIKFVVPCMILNSYIGSYEDNVLSNIGRSFLYSVVLCVLGIIISLVIAKFVREESRGIFKFACSFSNAAYMGFPLIRALFGDEGILYASAYVTVFNILLWTVGCVFFADRMPLKQLLKNLVSCPPIIAVAAGLIIYLLKIPVADVIAEPIGTIGAMTTPLSMIITGATMAENSFLSLLKKQNLCIAIVVRLVLIPLVCLVIFKLLGLNGMTAMVTLILEACPAAAITTLFAIQHNKDEQYAAAVVVISTFLSIITLPCYAYLLTCVLG